MTGARRASAGVEIEPPLEAFRAAYDAGRPSVVWTRLVADLETPVSAMLKLGRDRPMSFLLESVEGGAVRGRYSIIGLQPDIIWRAFGDRAEINRSPARDPSAFKRLKEGTLKALRSLIAESRIDLPPELPPMSSGIFGYMAYDTVRLIERLPTEKPDPLGLPDAILIRPTVMVIFDALKDEMTVVTPVFPRARQTADKAYAAARRRLGEVVGALEAPLPHTPPPASKAAPHPKQTSNTTPEGYEEMVRRGKEYIAAGDIFQVVLSQRF
ncbi:MAG: anthranilate synthase component I, partial [Hyphomicrobiaceae bacterium]|nr:anthranilate synthase component I [Hyphomicrobiaceae bacterium]